MIYFLNASGGVAHCLPESVYQGSAEGNTLFLVAPAAASAEVYAAFCLPDGSVTPRYRLEYAGTLNGYAGETGQAVCGWSLALPVSVTAQYGTVRVQFYIFAEGKKQTASAAAQFTVERGVESELPSAPDEDAYENISAALAALRADLINGYYPARASVAWNDGHVYGANELVFYPDSGKNGAILRSKVQNNVQKPYTDGVFNADFWEIVVHFDTIAEEYFDKLGEILSQGSAAVAAETEKAQTAQKAAENAKTGAETAAANAETSKNDAVNAAAQAETSASAAQGSADAAASSAAQAEKIATQAAGSATQAAQAETAAENAAQTAQTQAGAAAGSAQAAAGSAQTAGEHAQDAEEFAELARRYAEIGIQPNTDYSSLDELPRPGSTKFIYMIPNSNTEPVDSYSEYLWVPDKSDYEFIGSTKIDLPEYAKQNGTYPEMSVGQATRLSRSRNVNSENSGNFGWYKVGTVDVATLISEGGATTNSYSLIFLLNGANESGSGVASRLKSPSGLLELNARIEGGLFLTNVLPQVHVIAGDIAPDDFCVAVEDSQQTCSLYCRLSYGYKNIDFVILGENFNSREIDVFAFDGTFAGETLPAGANIGVYNGLPVSQFGDTTTGTTRYFEIANFKSISTNASVSAILLLNQYRYDALQHSGIIEIDMRMGDNVITYHAVKIICGNIQPTDVYSYVDENNVLHVYVSVVATVNNVSVLNSWYNSVVYQYPYTQADSLPEGAEQAVPVNAYAEVAERRRKATRICCRTVILH